MTKKLTLESFLRTCSQCGQTKDRGLFHRAGGPVCLPCIHKPDIQRRSRLREKARSWATRRAQQRHEELSGPREAYAEQLRATGQFTEEEIGQYVEQYLPAP